MGHVVVHRDAQGAWQLEDVASLEVALERVETLRNVEQRDEVRLFDEVALEVRTYYRVALAGGSPDPTDAPAPQPPAPVAPVPLTAVEDPPLVGDEPVGDPPPVDHDVSTQPDRGADVTPAAQPGWDPGLSPFPTDDGAAADSAPGAAAATPPPGTFPLAAPPVPAPSATEHDHDREASAAGGRRGSRFGRDR